MVDRNSLPMLFNYKVVVVERKNEVMTSKAEAVDVKNVDENVDVF